MGGTDALSLLREDSAHLEAGGDLGMHRPRLIGFDAYVAIGVTDGVGYGHGRPRGRRPTSRMAGNRNLEILERGAWWTMKGGPWRQSPDDRSATMAHERVEIRAKCTPGCVAGLSIPTRSARSTVRAEPSGDDIIGQNYLVRPVVVSAVPTAPVAKVVVREVLPPGA